MDGSVMNSATIYDLNLVIFELKLNIVVFVGNIKLEDSKSMFYLSTENNYIVNLYVKIIFFACRLLQDHSESTGVHSQALDTLKTKLEESERKLKASQESHKKMQVS